jgi:carbon monoxide dehydrogenase subunit G
MHISGKSVIVNKNINDVFNFLADFNNFERLMPEQVSEWQSDSESCSFSVKGMGKVGMKYAKKEFPTYIEMVPYGKSPISFALKITLAEEGATTRATGEVDADINPMLAMMAKRPLENLINEITSKLALTL